MNGKAIILAVLLVSVFLAGCASQSGYNGYSAYNQPQGQGQPQGQYVGGGCGVAPAGDYEKTPMEALNPADTAL